MAKLSEILGTTFVGNQGVGGVQGDPGPTGPGVPNGGTAGQALVKVDSTSQNTTWNDVVTPNGDEMLLNKTLFSPTLTGFPIAPTAPAETNTTQVATTAHVFAERSNPAALSNKAMVDSFGAGFANMVVLTSGTSWSIPTGLQYPGAKWKVTLVGGGGGGGGTSTVAGQTGNGGGSGGVVVGYITYAAGLTTMAYAVGAAGAASGVNTAGGNGGNTTVTYNGVTFTASGGVGGATFATVNGGGNGGAATGGTLNIAGFKGITGGVASATNPVLGMGANTPLHLGAGGNSNGTAAGGAGLTGFGYGAGGSGGKNGSGVTGRTGGAGMPGVVIVEY